MPSTQSSRALRGMTSREYFSRDKLLEDLLRLGEDAGGLDGRARRLRVLPEEVFLLLRRGVRDDHGHAHDEISPPAPPEAAEPPAAEADLRAGFRAPRDRDLFRLLERRDRELSAEDERRKRHLQVQDDVVALPLEDLVLRHRQHDVEIAGRPSPASPVSFAGQPQPRAGFDAGRNPDLQRARAAAPPLAAATLARLVHDPALAPAGRARTRHD